MGDTTGNRLPKRTIEGCRRAHRDATKTDRLDRTTIHNYYLLWSYLLFPPEGHSRLARLMSLAVKQRREGGWRPSIPHNRSSPIDTRPATVTSRAALTPSGPVLAAVCVAAESLTPTRTTYYLLGKIAHELLLLVTTLPILILGHQSNSCPQHSPGRHICHSILIAGSDSCRPLNPNLFHMFLLIIKSRQEYSRLTYISIFFLASSPTPS